MPNYKHKEKKKRTAKQLFFHIQEEEEKKSCLGAFYFMCLIFPSLRPRIWPQKTRMWPPRLWSKPMSSSLLLPTLFALDKHANPPTYCCSNCLKVIYSHQSFRFTRVVQFISTSFLKHNNFLRSSLLHKFSISCIKKEVFMPKKTILEFFFSPNLFLFLKSLKWHYSLSYRTLSTKS